jgi:hypothetical protein
MDWEILLDVFAVALACLAGLGLGISAMTVLYVLTSNSTWQRLRRRSRPFLWTLGLDWPEIKHTWKRAFMLYYARGLPDLQQPPNASDGASLDESQDASLADSQ